MRKRRRSLGKSTTRDLTMGKPDSVSGWDLQRSLVTLTAAASLVGIFLVTLRGPLAATGDGRWPLTWLAWPVAGWTVLTRRPGNRIGQLSMAIGATMGLAFGRLFVRGKRSSGTERQQFRWLFLGGGVFVVIGGAAQFLPENSSAETLWLLGGWSIPISIGVAVVRYRLYEIDRIISRTIGYGLVIGSLAIVGVVTVTLLTSLVSAESPLAVAGSTLAVAALFNPLRRRVQEWVNRPFNRARYDAQRVMERFAGSLQGRLDHDGVVDGWVGVVAETMQPASVAVWVREE